LQFLRIDEDPLNWNLSPTPRSNTLLPPAFFQVPETHIDVNPLTRSARAFPPQSLHRVLLKPFFAVPLQSFFDVAGCNFPSWSNSPLSFTLGGTLLIRPPQKEQPFFCISPARGDLICRPRTADHFPPCPVAGACFPFPPVPWSPPTGPALYVPTAYVM